MHANASVDPGNRERAAGGDGDSAGARDPSALHASAPRRMFLCDVPLFARWRGGNRGYDRGDAVRLMGTVVEMMNASEFSEGDTRVEGRPSSCTPSETETRLAACLPPDAVSQACFVMDDGTGSIGVYAERRGRRDVDRSRDAPMGNMSLALQKEGPQNTNQSQHPPATSKSSLISALESIISLTEPVRVGDTLDCIGRIHVCKKEDSGADGGNGDDNTAPPSPHRIWLLASSVSQLKDHQSATLRQLELSSVKRRRVSDDRDCTRRGGSTPRNRILVGGRLERGLNPLFHCNQRGSVAFDTERAFDYIRCSRDDGGITGREIASLAGAVDPGEVLAVNLAVERLREDCRIYLNQGRWFPM